MPFEVCAECAAAIYEMPWCSWEFQNIRLDHSVSVAILTL